MVAHFSFGFRSSQILFVAFSAFPPFPQTAPVRFDIFLRQAN
jgi:hypothetical protein